MNPIDSLVRRSRGLDSNRRTRLVRDMRQSIVARAGELMRATAKVYPGHRLRAAVRRILRGSGARGAAQFVGEAAEMPMTVTRVTGLAAPPRSIPAPEAVSPAWRG
jgi:hypothetical protein